MTFPMPHISPMSGAAPMLIREVGPDYWPTLRDPWAVGALRSGESGDMLFGTFVPEIHVPGTGSFLMQCIVGVGSNPFGISRYYQAIVVFTGSVSDAQWSGITVNGESFSRDLFIERSTGSGSWTDYTLYRTDLLLVSDNSAWLFRSLNVDIPSSFPPTLEGAKMPVEIY